MKQIIFILLSIAVFIGCQESNSVEPILDNPSQLKVLEAEIQPFIKNGETREVLVQGSYNFNPCNNCGGLLNGCCLDYRYDDAITNGRTTRYLTDVEFYAPSTMILDGKSIKTVNIYSLNRKERVLKSGKIIDGKVWGSFRVETAAGFHPLNSQKNPKALATGKFRGNIEGKVTKVYLVGKGQNLFADRMFSASSVQVCNADNGALICITAEFKGKFTPVIKLEE